MDALIVNHPAGIPDSITRQMFDARHDGVILQGRNPFRRSWLHQLLFDAPDGEYYEVSGWFVGVTRNGTGPVPVFHVSSYRRIDSVTAMGPVSPD